MYVPGAGGAIMYIAQIKEVVPASEATLSRSLKSYSGDQAPFDQNTRIGVFEPEPLSALSDPMLLATRVPYGLRYTDLESFRAETTDDIL
jgi:hypothetical protein